MKLLRWSPVDPRVSLAVDDALLEMAERGEAEEMLRIWEFSEPVVVLGRSCEAAREVRLDLCRHKKIPVLRRVSGGGTIVGGPGCLMYSVLLSIERRPQLRHLDLAHQTVLTRLAVALRAAAGLDAAIVGTSDIALPALGEESVLRKVSGNSLRVKRDWLLYHGTLLIDFDLALVSELLLPPPREPEYRAARDHQQFVTNLQIDQAALEHALVHAFGAAGESARPSESELDQLVRDRYGNDAWNFSR